MMLTKAQIEILVQKLGLIIGQTHSFKLGKIKLKLFIGNSNIFLAKMNQLSQSLIQSCEIRHLENYKIVTLYSPSRYFSRHKLAYAGLISFCSVL